jgi:phage terminase small subunit
MPRRAAYRPPKPPPILSQHVGGPGRVDGSSPLDHMLTVMRDRTADPKRRDRMAIAAAPYCHARLADYRKGAKDLKAEAADNAGDGSVWETDLQYSDGLPRQ